MSYPIGYYASAVSGTSDAAILTKLEQQIGSFSQNLSRADRLSCLAVLAVYLLNAEIGVEYYKLRDAVFDTLPDLDAGIGNTILLIEGISESNALGLISFFAAQLNARCFR